MICSPLFFASLALGQRAITENEWKGLSTDTEANAFGKDQWAKLLNACEDRTSMGEFQCQRRVGCEWANGKCSDPSKPTTGVLARGNTATVQVGSSGTGPAAPPAVLEDMWVREGGDCTRWIGSCPEPKYHKWASEKCAKTCAKVAATSVRDRWVKNGERHYCGRYTHGCQDRDTFGDWAANKCALTCLFNR